VVARAPLRLTAGQSGLLGCALVAAAAALLVVAGTPHGIGLSHDTDAYVSAARSLLAGEGFRVRGEPLAHYPPLYPAMLALSASWSGDVVEGARLLQALLFAATAALVAGCAWRSSGSVVAGLLAAGLVLACRSTLRVHLMAWSEPLFLLLSLAGLWLLALHLDRPRPVLRLGAALMLAGALLTRYAGIALLVPAAAGILLFAGGSVRRRARDAGILLALASGPLALWLVRNAALSGGAVHRSLAVHPVTAAQLEDGLRTLSFWIWPFQLGSLLGAVVLALALAGAAAASLRRSGTPLERLLWLFLLAYPVFLLLSISFVDAETPLRERTLAPLYLAGVLLGVLLACRAPAGPVRTVAALLGVLLVAVHALRGFDLWEASRRTGLGYADQRWNESELLRELRALPDGTLLYSNAPDLISLRLARPARWLPRHFDGTAQRENPAFEQELLRMRQDLERGARVAWFERMAWRSYVLGPAELERAGLTAVAELLDGRILALPPSGASSPAESRKRATASAARR
jgi:4-amino-4-deoxy-L-arabinose transferase-like glycosyltransferase